MEKCDFNQSNRPFFKWVLIGIPILFIIATPLHFLYDWTMQNIVAGLFTPVNESPWEHLKLAFWPILIWWVIGYLHFGRKQDKCFSQYAISCVMAEIVSVLFVITFFYTYTGAFGIESLFLDILSLLLGLLIGFLFAIHVHKYSTPSTLAKFISIVILIIMVSTSIFFTFVPPHIPLFADPTTGTYGISCSTLVNLIHCH